MLRAATYAHMRCFPVMKGHDWIRTEYYLAQSAFPHHRLRLTSRRAMAESFNPFRYVRLPNRYAEGRCLWYSTTVGIIEDVGFGREGYFDKVSNLVRLIVSNWYSHVRSVDQRIRATEPCVISAYHHHHPRKRRSPDGLGRGRSCNRTSRGDTTIINSHPQSRHRLCQV